jgi:hypothetical protein
MHLATPGAKSFYSVVGLAPDFKGMRLSKSSF